MNYGKVKVKILELITGDKDSTVTEYMPCRFVFRYQHFGGAGNEGRVATLRTEMLVFTYQSTCDIADGSSLQQHQSLNLKSHKWR